MQMIALLNRLLLYHWTLKTTNMLYFVGIYTMALQYILRLSYNCIKFTKSLLY